MSLPKLAARVVLGYVGLVEGTAALIRFRERPRAFQVAVQPASGLGRPLIVVGDPDVGMYTRLMRAYGCGDVCVDLDGCPRCPVTVVADITKGPIPDIADDSAVVFVSCVFEYVAELDAALREVSRIAGSPENVFVVTVQPWTLTARLYPGAHWRGTVSSAAGGQTVDMERVSLEEKLIVSGALGLALAAAFWPERRR